MTMKYVVLTQAGTENGYLAIALGLDAAIPAFWTNDSEIGTQDNTCINMSEIEGKTAIVEESFGAVVDQLQKLGCKFQVSDQIIINQAKAMANAPIGREVIGGPNGANTTANPED